MARLQEHYKTVVVKDLMKKFGYKSVMQVPRIQKIVLNMGVGEAVGDKKIMDNAVGDLTKIAGQKPVVTLARTVDRDVQDPQGLSGRLHGDAARTRACTSSSIGWSRSRSRASATSAASRRRSFDGRGNFNMGVKEQIIFPEIEYDKIDATPRPEYQHCHHREDR